jgi:hypothetical protein
MTQRKNRVFVFLIVAASMLACAVPALAPAPVPIPTFDPNAPFTAIVQTAGAAATQTALVTTSTFTPTPQPSPSRTPTITETATPTFIFLLPTLTFTATPVTIVPSSADYACQVISQTPQNGSVIPRGEAFDAKWRVANVGRQDWNRTSADYIYNSGDRLHRQAGYDFEVSVSSGGSVELVVRMLAPTQPGRYSTSWRIQIGRQVFCPLNLTINVN